MWLVFKTFFLLGWISFGGPAAHIGYFRHTFVEKLNWISEHEYGQLVALSQFLPGPGSSQVGFALGYHRAGLLGAIAAFLGFTLPSIFIMLILASFSHLILDTSLYSGVIHGLKILAVIVVIDAVWGMFQSFCQRKTTISLCVFTAFVLLVLPSIWSQIVVLLIAALVGILKLQPLQTIDDNLQPVTPKPQSTFSVLPMTLFIIGLFVLPLIATALPSLTLFTHLFQAGSLVFGGGHVVLPLLQELVGSQLSADTFLSGYALAQAVPGPMFTFATYLGYALLPSSPIFGAIVATIGVFLPGFLLILTVLKNWKAFSQRPKIAGAMLGVNAAVVGLLIAALYQPVFSSAVQSNLDMALVIIGFYVLKILKLPIIALVGLAITYGILISF